MNMKKSRIICTLRRSIIDEYRNQGRRSVIKLGEAHNFFFLPWNFMKASSRK